MPCAEGIVWALGTVGEPRYSLVLSECIEPYPSSGKQLMGVTLVPYIPDNLVLGTVEYSMQGNRELYCSQAGSEMPSGPSHGIHKFTPNFLSELA
jgi:hypothetical protein